MSPAILVETDGHTDSSSVSAHTSFSDSTVSDYYAHTERPESDQSETIDGLDKDDIAIIGFSLRFPGEAISADEFWKILVQAKCTATQFPPERLNYDAFYSADPTAMGTVRRFIFYQGKL
jgi:hypothetical protein